jgi:hypothetical protein
MNNIKFKVINHEHEFIIDKYNQIINPSISGLYISFFERLNDFNSVKYDDYINDMYEGNIYFGNKKASKKDILFIDFSNTDGILKNLSFDKNSIIRKNFITELNNTFEEEKYEKIASSIIDVINNKNINYEHKEPTIEKIFDLFFEATDAKLENMLNNLTSFSQMVKKYKEYNPGTNIFMLTNSQLFNIDIKEFLEIKDLYIFDLNCNFNKYSANFIHFSDMIENFDINNILNRLELNWPTETTNEKLIILLQEKFASILNGTIMMNNNIRDEDYVLFILLCRLFSLNYLEKSTFNRFDINKKYDSFIKENML